MSRLNRVVKNLKPFCAYIIISVLTCSAMAQGSSNQESPGNQSSSEPKLEEIVVTADRPDSLGADFVQAGTFRNARVLDTPLTANIFTKKLLDAQQAQSIADVIRNSPGVTLDQINDTIYSNLAIRGVKTGFTTNYRLNGLLPIVNRIDMPMENKERIEVLKGAAGMFYGFASPSGIVNLVTERPRELMIQASAFGNSHGGLGGTVDISNKWSTQGFRINAALSSIETGIDYTSGERKFASLAYDWIPNEKFSFLFDGEYIDKEITEPTLIVLPAPVNGVITVPPLLDASKNSGSEWLKADAYAYNLSARAQYEFSQAWSLKVSVGHSYLDTLRRFSGFFGLDVPTGDGSVLVFTFPGNTFDRLYYRADLAGVFRTGSIEHEVIFGVSRDEMDIVTPGGVGQGAIAQNYYNPVNRLPAEPTPDRVISNINETRETGIYFMDRVRATDWLEFTIGVRATDYTNESFTEKVDESPETYSGSIILKPTDTLTFYASYIEGLEEGGIAPGISNNPGEVLPAAVSEQLEAGVKKELSNGVLLTAAIFDIDRETSFLNSDNFFVKEGRATYTGLEVSAAGELTDNLSISANATYIDAEQKTGPEAIIGNTIENTPDFSGSIFLQYAFQRLPQLSITGGVFHTGQRHVNANNNAEVDGYTLLDLGASYEIEAGDSSIILRIYGTNITGEEYWAATGSSLVQQGPPSTIKFSVTASF